MDKIFDTVCNMFVLINGNLELSQETERMLEAAELKEGFVAIMQASPAFCHTIATALEKQDAILNLDVLDI